MSRHILFYLMMMIIFYADFHETQPYGELLPFKNAYINPPGMCGQLPYVSNGAYFQAYPVKLVYVMEHPQEPSPDLGTVSLQGQLGSTEAQVMQTPSSVQTSQGPIASFLVQDSQGSTVSYGTESSKSDKSPSDYTIYEEHDKKVPNITQETNSSWIEKVKNNVMRNHSEKNAEPKRTSTESSTVVTAKTDVITKLLTPTTSTEKVINVVHNSIVEAEEKLLPMFHIRSAKNESNVSETGICSDVNRKNNVNCQCGVIQKVNFVNASKSENPVPPTTGNWPWLVALKYESEKGNRSAFSCAAALISDTWLVTSALCVNRSHSEYKLKSAQLGDINLDPEVTDGANEVVISVVDWIEHPEFNETGNFENNIGLVKLGQPVNFTNMIQPICLPHEDKYLKDDTYRNKTLKFAGWGRLYTHTLPKSKNLLEVNVTMYNTSFCKRKLSNTKNLLIDERSLCTFVQKEDICKISTGGPITIKIADHHYLAGVFSTTTGTCSSNRVQTHVFTKIARYSEWISNITGIHSSMN